MSASVAIATPATTKIEYGIQLIVPPPMVCDALRHPGDERAVGGPQSEPAHDAERRQRDDERVRHAPVDVDQAVHRADREAGAEDRGDHEDARARVLEDDRADDARERDRRADGEVDAPRDDHEQLTERDDGDHRGLREDVADVAARQEDRRRQGDDDDQQEQDQGGAGAQRQERRLQQAIAVEPEEPAMALAVPLLRRHGHLPPTAPSNDSQAGPAGNSYSSSEDGSISML